jgi:hypothetical protein
MSSIKEEVEEEEEDKNQQLINEDSRSSSLRSLIKSDNENDDNDDDDDDDGEINLNKKKNDQKVEEEEEEEEEEEGSTSGDGDTQQIKEEDEEEIAAKQAKIDESVDNRLKLLENVNYAVVLSFFEKFKPFLTIKDYNFKAFESHLLNSRLITKKLIDLHLYLLKNLNFAKKAKKDCWQTYIIKYLNRYTTLPLDDIHFFENNGYPLCSIEFKINLIKHLLESQFDDNQKFKQTLADNINDPTLLRTVPFGRDKDGCYYYFFMDNEFTIRLFTLETIEKTVGKHKQDQEIWKIIGQ